MCIFEHLKLRNFRNYTNADFRFEKGINIIFGSNGKGKTNLLEAIYCVIRKGKSFRPGKQPLIKEGQCNCHVSLRVSAPDSIAETLGLAVEQGKRTYFRNGKRLYKNPEFFRKYPVIVFLPEDKLLIKNEPRKRRDFIDKAISSFDPDYEKLISQYVRCCKMRRAVFYTGKQNTHLNMEWLKKACSVITKRINYINELNRELSEMGKIDLVVGYATTAGQITKNSENEIKEMLLKKSKEVEAREKQMKRILAGPHLDDYRFFLGRKDARFFASSGETKLAVFWLKFAHARMIRRICSDSPVLLIDEFMETFDRTKLQILLEGFPQSQAIFTSCREDIFDLIPDATEYRI